MSQKRVFNFSAGPAMLPEAVLSRASEEMLSYGSSGMSVMEMSHRSGAYKKIIDAASEKLRRLLSVPDNYSILFLQGGASLQFAMVPMNLMVKNRKADYAVTGNFSKKAMQQAREYGEISIAADMKDEKYKRIPTQSELTLDADADYFHYCSNNTIYGTTWQYVPETGSVPLVCDMSSNILSCPVDVSRYGIIYAGAQKNMGPAGLTVAIVRNDLIPESALPGTPEMMKYSVMSKNDSMYNTPPTYAIYILGLVLDWLSDLGGLEEMEKRNRAKAAPLYDYLDNSKLFAPIAGKEDRSFMNVSFAAANEELDKKFIAEAAENNLVTLKGHRVLGGMRASIYNAMPAEGILALVSFMEKFERANG